MNKNKSFILENIAYLIGAVLEWKAAQVESQCGAGQVRTVYMRREFKTLKNCPWKVYKFSGFQMQCGIEYEKRAKVKADKASGKVGKLTREDYAKRVPGWRSVMVNRKDIEGRNGKDEATRLENQTNPTYYLCGGIWERLFSNLYDQDGNALTKAQVEPFRYSSEIPKSTPPNWTRVKLQNLITLN